MLPATVTTNGVDHLRFPQLESDEQSVRTGAVFVGRLEPSKNAADAIRAWAIVAKEFAHEKLTIIGAVEVPKYARELKALVAHLGLQEQVQFAGAVSEAEKAKALMRARFFLFPSTVEGWGIAIAEAMRAGLPCITYDLPIFREIFPSGRLDAPMGDYAGLAQHAMAFLRDERLWARYASEAEALAREFSWDRASRVEAAAMDALLRRKRDSIAAKSN